MFGRHHKEFSRAITRREYERTPEGVYFPKAGALLSGEFKWDGKYGVRKKRNLVTDLALTALATMAGNQSIVDAAHFVTLFGYPTPPQPWWGFLDLWLAEELLDAPDGYDPATNRPDWVAVDEGSNTIGNTASPAAFTLRATSAITVSGFALGSYAGSAKGDGITQLAVDITAITDPTPTFTPIPCGKGVAYFAGSTFWLDPDNDDFFDSGLGHWVDGGSNAFTPTQDGVTSMVSGDSIFSANPGYLTGGFGGVFAAVEFGDAPESYSDMDPLNVTYRVVLS